MREAVVFAFTSVPRGFAILDHDGPQFPATRLVENHPRLDIWELQRAGSLVVGTETAISLQGNPVGYLRPLPSSRIQIELAGLTCEVMLVEDVPMPGVPRLWFQCPGCQRKVRHLYLPELRCRLCLRLEHACRHRQRWGNAARVKWLRARLHAEHSRGRRWPRWRRLAAQLALEERRLVGRLRRFAAALEKVRPDDR